ncbi:Na+/H+ antiporter NhaA [Methyloligella sp. 2.7D]|uniref:Na+/H+ antiporter NhaA n=1 Tax=unclassified Methyloligella TaxID=2625955 RepID=UPI001FF012B1|nr:Na+/H+ antiporter NhaA [Methyloligella sp. GL2]
MSILLRSKAAFRDFVEAESAGGLVLMGAAAVGFFLANSHWSDEYTHVLHSKVGGLDVLHWINDGLMALFFLLVGLEIKREMVDGQLSTWSTRVLPCAAAIGGMVFPAIIFMAVNWDVPEDWRGWAIPSATDIAFALGVLSFFNSRVPNSLKVFLTSLAIIDDLGAILIIALFYSSGFSFLALGIDVLALIALIALNRFGVMKLIPYLILGFILWGAMLFSGLHATLAGVLLAMTIPIGALGKGEMDADGEHEGHTTSPLHRLEHGLEKWVAFLIVPIFGLANAGVSLEGVGFDVMFHPLALGIILGLFLGKQLGIMLTVWAATKTGLANWPEGATWRQTYGVSIFCGIGFTMSLFIGLLAFPDVERQDITKLAVLVGSLLSVVAGSIVFLSPGGKRLAELAKEEERVPRF